MAEIKKKDDNKSTKNKSTDAKASVKKKVETKENVEKANKQKDNNPKLKDEPSLTEKVKVKEIVKNSKEEKIVLKDESTLNENVKVKEVVKKPKQEKIVPKVEPSLSEKVKVKEIVKNPKEEISLKKETKKKKHIIKYLLYVVIIILIGVFGYSGYKIISWRIDNQKTQDIIDSLKDSVDIKENAGKNVEIVVKEFTEDVLQYLAMDFIDIDFTDLKEDNEDVVGWVEVEGTKVNYPFVQTNNNSYYLYHSIDKSSNEAGWIFLDYRNTLWQEKNTIIYGHGRLNKTMFGSLNDILTSGWTDDTENFVIKISTEDENSVWQIFSAYHIANSPRPDYSQISFSSNEDFTNFTNKLIKRSMFDFKTTVDADDKILTLSTCYSNTEKMVIHAKLIKREIKTTEETEN